MDTSSLLIVLLEVVVERVHVATGGEGVVEVGEDVIGRERDELALTEEGLAGRVGEWECIQRPGTGAWTSDHACNGRAWRVGDWACMLQRALRG